MLNWESLQTACLSCTSCPLSQTRHNVVFGVGPQDVGRNGERAAQQREAMRAQHEAAKAEREADRASRTIDLDAARRAREV